MGITAGRNGPGELRIALEELLARTASFERAGEPSMLGWPVYGPESLPLAVATAS